MKFSNREKLNIIIAMLKDHKKTKELSKKYKIGLSTVYKWKSRFIDGGLAGLEEYKTGPKLEKKETEEKRRLNKIKVDYEKRIAELAAELEIVKKNENGRNEALN